MSGAPKILVTNDDGIDSVGLHELARAMRPLGDVTIVAPDREFSGAGAAVGALFLDQPEVRQAQVDGIEAVWTVGGPPAACILYAMRGAFGFTPDIVVSGINPGANVGRAVYHSGTIGAALTARNYDVPGIAVSQLITNFDMAGQTWGEMVAELTWDTAATVAATVVESMLANPRTPPGTLNLNVPDLPIEEVKGWAWADVGTLLGRSGATISLKPKEGSDGAYEVEYQYGEPIDTAPNDDMTLVRNGMVSLSWLSQIVAVNGENPDMDTALKGLLG